MTLKRDARGTLRDYERELEGELLSIFLSLFKSFEIFGVAFSPASLFEPNSDSPWGSFSVFDETHSTHSASAVTTTEERGVMGITFWGDKTEIFFAIVKSVSIYMVYKSPAVFWLANNVIMNKVVAKSSIAIIAFIKFNSKELFVVNIFIDDSMADKLMFHVVQWGFYDFSINSGIMEYPFLVYWWDRVFISSSHSPIVELAEPFCEVRTVTPWNFAYHNNIISKNYKVSRRNNG